MDKSDKRPLTELLAKKPALFKIVSKFKQGQKIYAIYEGKVVHGIITGFNPAMVSVREYYNNVNQYEIYAIDEYITVQEANCYKSMRALIIGIKK